MSSQCMKRETKLYHTAEPLSTTFLWLAKHRKAAEKKVHLVPRTSITICSMQLQTVCVHQAHGQLTLCSRPSHFDDSTHLKQGSGCGSILGFADCTPPIHLLSQTIHLCIGSHECCRTNFKKSASRSSAAAESAWIRSCNQSSFKRARARHSEHLNCTQHEALP